MAELDPELDAIWNQKAAGSTLDPELDAVWNKPTDKGTFLHPIKPEGTGLGAVGQRIMQYPGLIAGKIVDALKEGPQLMGDVATGKVDPISREGVERATDVAATFSPGAPMRAGVKTAAKAAALPEKEEVLQAANAGYKDLREMNVPLKKEAVQEFADKIKPDLTERAFYKEDQPRSFRALERLKNPETGESSSNEVYAVRTSLNNVIKDHPGTSDAAAASMLIDHLDDYLSNVPEFSKTAKEARGNYRAGKSVERVDEALERGRLNAATSGSGANLVNNLRQSVKRIYLNKKIPKTPEEAALMKGIAEGTTAGNLARLFSKLGPSHPLSGWGSAIAADLKGRSGAGAASMALGALAQHIAERSTSRQIGKLRDSILRNSPLGQQMAKNASLPKVVRPPLVGAITIPSADALKSPSDPLSGGE